MTADRRGEFALGAGYFAYFGAVGIFQPYWPVHLKELGYSAAAIGALMAAFSAVRVVGPIGSAWLADHLPDRRPLMLASAALAAATVLALGYAEALWASLLGLCAFSLFFNSIMPVYDAHTLDRLGAHSDRYGWLRLWGSVGFVVTSYAAGLGIDRFGGGLIPWALFATVVASALLMLALPATTRRSGKPAPAGTFVAALKRPPVVAFLAICFLQLASFGGYYSFYTLYLQSYGYDAATIGFYWAWGVVAEIAVFLAGPRLVRRFPLLTLLYLALLGTAVRWGLLAAFPERPGVMLFAQTLHLFGFGLFHAVTVLLAPRLLPAGSEARAQALVSSFGWGAGGIAGSLLAGWLWDATGPRSVYAAGLIIVTLALLVAFAGLRGVPQDRVHPQASEPQP
jgi:MFS transporter, PPP family, 3-phenylpropionic acid transporter